MKIRVLGAAAGGGFPQWNCNCRNCAGVRAGTLNAKRRTQSSIAVSSTGEQWVLINASPDILSQLAANPMLQPGRALRDHAIAGIVLADGQVDHTTGLFMLREAMQPWRIWCTDAVHADLTRGNPIFSVLSHFCGVDRQTIQLDGSAFSVAEHDTLSIRALPVDGKPAPYSPNREHPIPGDNIALCIGDRTHARYAFYAPGLARISDDVWHAMCNAACVMVDGTFWRDDEMVQLGISKKRGRDIGHLPQSGDGGMIEWLDRLPPGVRKVLIHINNTNPILDEDSPERAQLDAHGIEVAYDGMEIAL